MWFFENSFYDDQFCKESDYLRRILTANVYEVAKETPLHLASNLSDRLSTEILLKREDLQPVFSFKLRGAYNRMAQLSAEERSKGVITCSAGNHAQGVALSAQKLGVKAIIVMPIATPPIKWKNVKRLGAEIVLHGNDFDESKMECNRIAKVFYCFRKLQALILNRKEDLSLFRPSMIRL